MSTAPQDLRVDYAGGKLELADMAADPYTQFARWFADALAAQVLEPNAMTLATADAGGIPSARVVLLKGFDSHGFSFYTNYESVKGRELAANPNAALCFFWPALERQVRIVGRVERVSREESEAYFHSRPLASQIGACASQQSEVIRSREELEAREATLKMKFFGVAVPLPEFWGGYRVMAANVEFWQGRPSRLHDRLRYLRQADGSWRIDRLSP